MLILYELRAFHYRHWVNVGCVWMFGAEWNGCVRMSEIIVTRKRQTRDLEQWLMMFSCFGFVCLLLSLLCQKAWCACLELRCINTNVCLHGEMFCSKKLWISHFLHHDNAGIMDFSINASLCRTRQLPNSTIINACTDFDNHFCHTAVRCLCSGQ